jgi:ribosomal protein S18 acetylase RimI-like enzyme
MELSEIRDVTRYSDIWNIYGKEQRLNDEIRKKTRKMYVLTDNMLPTGGISVVFNSNDERTIKEQRAHLSYFVVKPEYRNRGIGTQILHQIIFMLQNNNINEITIQVDKDNIDALRLYYREGFVQILHEKENKLLLMRKLRTE